MVKFKTEVCEHCNGTGRVPAADIGGVLCKEREKAGVSSRQMALALGVSPTHLLDMEKGRRGMSLSRVESYLDKLEELRDGS